MGISEHYAKEVRRQLKPLFPLWEPMSKVKIGDYGVVKDGIFVRQGNVVQRGVTKPGTVDGAKGEYFQFFTSGSMSLNLDTSGGASAGGQKLAAGVKLAFAKENTVFFNAAGCSEESVDDIIALGDEIKALGDAWRNEWSVVTKIIYATSFIAALSSAANAELDLQADVKIAQVGDLADAKIKWNVAAKKNVGYEAVIRNNTPLVGLHRIHTRWFDAPDFKPELKNALKLYDNLAALDWRSGGKTRTARLAVHTFEQLR